MKPDSMVFLQSYSASFLVGVGYRQRVEFELNLITVVVFLSKDEEGKGAREIRMQDLFVSGVL